MKFSATTKYSFYNLIGLGLPLIVAIFCIPVLIQELGEARFGLLTLIWAVVSYFGLFDLGMGRALTLMLSVVIAKNDTKMIGQLVKTSIVMMMVLGVFAGLMMAIIAPFSVTLIKSVPNSDELFYSVIMMALAMPAIILTSGFRGILEAYNKFGIINMIRIPLGLFTFLGPVLVVVLITPRLDAITGVLAAGRITACGIYGWYSWKSLPLDNGGYKFNKNLLKPLFVSGGWMTLSNLISPFMGYIDRFVIGTIISAAAVAFYTTPQEIITKLWIIPGALTSVLFPAFTKKITQNDEKTQEIFDKAVKALFFIVLPITIILALFANEILTIWIGTEFATQSATMMKVFAFGILINCLSHIPYTLIQSAGQPRITAILHLVQLPLFVLGLWLLTLNYGPMGAAIAWLGRLILDAFLMFGASNNMQKWQKNQDAILKLFGYIFIAILAFLGLLIENFYLRIVWSLLTLFISLFILLKYVLVRKKSTN